MIRVVLPTHLRDLASVGAEVEIEVPEVASVRSVLDALERRFPMLRGTIREYATRERRPFIRFFACGEDISHESVELPLPAAVAEGREPLLVVGAIAGG